MLVAQEDGQRMLGFIEGNRKGGKRITGQLQAWASEVAEQP